MEDDSVYGVPRLPFQEGVTMEKGFFVISDISGYTDFLTQSELEHANEIIKGLMETITKNVITPLKISNFQGDAILMYAPAKQVLIGQTLVHQIERIYYEFKKYLQQMHINTTCECKACRNIPTLDLKFFVHFGDFVIQKIDKREELTGTDVILIHRLMKNDVVKETGVKAYTLFTEQASNELGIDTYCNDLKDHRETVENMGAIKTKVYCMNTAWEKELQSEEERVIISPGEQWVRVDMTLSEPPDVVWNYLIHADLKRQWMGMNDVIHTPAKANSYGKGSQYHCAHDMGDFDYAIKDWRPFQYLTVDGIFPGNFAYRQMDILKPTEDGSDYTVLVAPRRINLIQGFLNQRRANKLKGDFQKIYQTTRNSLAELISARHAQEIDP